MLPNSADTPDFELTLEIHPDDPDLFVLTLETLTPREPTALNDVRAHRRIRNMAAIAACAAIALAYTVKPIDLILAATII